MDKKVLNTDEPEVSSDDNEDLFKEIMLKRDEQDSGEDDTDQSDEDDPYQRLL